MKARRGFTLFELIISLALGLILLGLAIFATVRFFENRELEIVSDTAVSYLRTAVGRSMESEDNMSHGVAIAGGGLTLFLGPSYAERDTARDSVYLFPAYIQFSGLSEIVFAKKTGVPSSAGTITLTNGIRTSVITIYSTGAVSRQ